MFRWLLLLVALFLPVLGLAQKTVRVSELKDHLDKVVEVKVRTGEFVESLEGEGKRVFTVRDDFGGMAYVETPASSVAPIMGATYFIRGTVKQKGDTERLTIESNAATMRLAYAQADRTPLILGVSLAIAAAFAIVLHRMRRPKPWGYLYILTGQGATTWLTLRYRETPIGRSVDADRGIRLGEQDRVVSGLHGVISRKGKKVTYTDRSSNGTKVVVGGKSRSLAKNDDADLNEGDQLVLGMTVLEFRSSKNGSGVASGTIDITQIDKTSSAGTTRL